MQTKFLRGSIPVSFEATGVDPETGSELTETVKATISRLAYDTVSNEEFTDAIDKITKEPRVLGDLLAGDGTKPGILESWELFEDEAKAEMLAITCENIIALPYDFVIALAEAVFGRLFPQMRTAKNSVDGLASAAVTTRSAMNTLKEASNGDMPSQKPQDSGESLLTN